MTEAGKDKSIRANVPGCIHTDLLAAGEIDDPFFRDNENHLQWIGAADWIYSRSFNVPDGLLQHDRILLGCEGLDTLATITINGRKIARTDNMFRLWEFDVKSFLQCGTNSLEVRFASTIPYIRSRHTRRPIPSWLVPDVQDHHGQWVRKEPCNFGWDWGPRLITCGIWRGIRILAFDNARIGEFQIRQDHSRTGAVCLDIIVKADVVKKSPLTLEVRASFKGRKAAETKLSFQGKTARAKLLIKNPRLWWPHDMGPQNLYEITVHLYDGNGTILDADSKRIGLRILHLQRRRDKWGESFQFMVNGLAFFAKGANWIPADTFAPRMTRARYLHLLKSATAAHMNMLRVWGGGIYENNTFYDLCDELGLCVWQDFMFACAAYPAFDNAFLDNVKAEAQDNVRRLRHHPCLALWCGNNELEQGLVGAQWDKTHMSWLDYAKLFDKLLPRIITKLDPERDYWPSSPHSPRGQRTEYNNPHCGDGHLWDIWHLKQPFEWYRTCYHRFVSEFGFQSFPEPGTVKKFTLTQDRNITSRIMEHHQRSQSGNRTIISYLLDWFRLPRDFEMTLWLSQILQGLAIKCAVEHFRRHMPRTMGVLFWQLNDCWPATSWSSLDYHGRWKALHYLARRFFAPLLVSALEERKTGKVRIYTSSDLLRSCRAKLTWTLTNIAGKTLIQDTKNITIAPRKSKGVQILYLADFIEQYGRRDLLLWLDLSVRGKSQSGNLLTFAPPKHLELPHPQITSHVKTAGEKDFLVTLKTEKPALWTWLDIPGAGAHFTDNFFHLRPHQNYTVLACPAKPMSLDRFRKKLRLRSLRDTYP